MIRRQCLVCKRVEPMRPDERTCSIACEAQRRKATGHYRRMGLAAAEAKRRKARTWLKGFGELTPREQAIYQRGRKNALTYSRAQQREFGYRKGWAEALGEHDAREVWQ